MRLPTTVLRQFITQLHRHVGQTVVTCKFYTDNPARPAQAWRLRQNGKHLLLSPSPGKHFHTGLSVCLLRPPAPAPRTRVRDLCNKQALPGSRLRVSRETHEPSSTTLTVSSGGQDLPHGREAHDVDGLGVAGQIGQELNDGLPVRAFLHLPDLVMPKQAARAAE